jgi:DNA repair protein RecO (recombination protein O)
MRLSHITPAIVLRARPFGDSDLIVSLLTEQHGKVTGIAKGAKRSRKRFANSFEPFSFVNLRFQDRPHSALVFILACDLAFGSWSKRLHNSLEKIAYASYLVEITDGFIGEREENQAVFNHLKEGLTYIEEHEPSLTFLTLFELNLLRLVGYQPALDRCLRCDADRGQTASTAWYFSVRDGGVLCLSCAQLRTEVVSLKTRDLDFLANIQNVGTTQTPLLPPVNKEVRHVVSGFIQFHLGKEIKSASFLQEFASF